MSQTVVVTGAARGIGASIAERFASAGWRVVLADIVSEVDVTAKRVAAETGGSVSTVVADVSTPSGADAVAAAVGGELHALVNNAGITRDAMLKKMTQEQFASVTRVNLGGPIQLISVLLPLMPDGASVVNVSSKSASGNVGQFNYAVSKAGLLGLTRSLARTLAPRVRVNAISPAFIATEMTDAIPDPVRTQILSRIPFGRPGQPSEIADVALWLTSPAASYLTGQVIPVCGGRSFAP